MRFKNFCIPIRPESSKANFFLPCVQFMEFKHSLKYWYEFLAQLTRFLDAPKFLREPTDISGEKGQDATLTCLVDGNPAPSYTWFKNGDFQTVISHRARFPDLQERNCSAGTLRCTNSKWVHKLIFGKRHAPRSERIFDLSRN